MLLRVLTFSEVEKLDGLAIPLSKDVLNLNFNAQIEIWHISTHVTRRDGTTDDTKLKVERWYDILKF